MCRVYMGTSVRTRVVVVPRTFSSPSVSSSANFAFSCLKSRYDVTELAIPVSCGKMNEQTPPAMMEEI